MTVYVDNMTARHGRLVLCHMIASTDEELRAMANTVGLSQRWHQQDHFDIGKTKRALVVAAGAVEISRRQCAAMRARQRETGELGDPECAERWWRARHRLSSDEAT